MLRKLNINEDLEAKGRRVPNELLMIFDIGCDWGEVLVFTSDHCT